MGNNWVGLDRTWKVDWLGNPDAAGSDVDAA